MRANEPYFLKTKARRVWLLALAAAAIGCRNHRKPDLAFFQALPATTTALAVCERPADCRLTAAWRKFQPNPAAVAMVGAGPVVLFQNEYSPAFLLPPGAQTASQGEAKVYRGLGYRLMPSRLGRKTDTPADSESWAFFTIPGRAAAAERVAIGGETAILDLIDVAAGVKPSLAAARGELHPLFERFGSGAGTAAVEYTFSAQAQQQGIEGGLDALLGSWPVRTVLGPVTSYRGRATRFERDGARCRLSYGVQLTSGVAARLLSGAIYTAVSAGTFAGWPLSPDYLSKWRSERDGDLVMLALDLTRAGCEYWEKR